jgi:hypothetical protein
MGPNHIMMNVDSAFYYAPNLSGTYESVPESPDNKVQISNYQMINSTIIDDNDIMSSLALTNGMTEQKLALQQWFATNGSLNTTPVMQQLQTPLDDSFMMDDSLFDPSDVMLGSPTEEKISLGSPVNSSFGESDSPEMMSGTFDDNILLDELHSSLDFFSESGFSSLAEASALAMVSPTIQCHSIPRNNRKVKQKDIIDTYIKLEPENEQQQPPQSSSSKYLQNDLHLYFFFFFKKKLSEMICLFFF